jgi:hypothetical protein
MVLHVAHHAPAAAGGILLATGLAEPIIPRLDSSFVSRRSFSPLLYLRPFHLQSEACRTDELLTQWRRLDTTLMTRATMTAPNKYERRA